MKNCSATSPFYIFEARAQSPSGVATAGGVYGIVFSVKSRFDKLIAEGEGFRADFLDGYRYRWYRYSPLNAGYVRWKQDCLRSLREAFGPASPHYTGLLEAEKVFGGRAPGSVFSMFLGTMKQAVTEYRPVPSAPAVPAYASDLVEEVLARAEALAARGHYASAMTLAGAMLEGLLRRLCASKGVFCPPGASLESLNDRLLEARVYGRPRHREAGLRLALRRSAELCYTDKLNAANVGEAIAWLRGFAAEYFPSAAGTRRGPAL